MTEKDREYYMRRLTEERARAQASGPTAPIHAELAERYAELLEGKRAEADEIAA